MIYYIVAFALIILIVLYSSTQKPYNFPPGPRWWPIVGCLPAVKTLTKQLGGQHLAQVELAKRFNTDILGLKLGIIEVVIVFSPKLVNAINSSDLFQNRPDTFFSRLRSFGTKKGITFAEGKLWEIQRKFVVRHLRYLGFGSKVMFEFIQEQTSEMLNIIEENRAEVNLQRLFQNRILNMLWSIVTGSPIPRNDSRLTRILDLCDRRSAAFDIAGGYLSQCPWLRHIAPEMTGYNLILQLNDEFKGFLMEPINEHFKTWTEGNNDDLIYSFISEMRTGRDTSFTVDQLLMVCADLFIGGTQTTSSLLNSAFRMMILHPDIQRKVQLELDNVFPETEIIEYDNRQRVPYVMAVLSEVQRFCGIVAINGPRIVAQNTVLGGYNIPKGTIVLQNLYSLRMNEETWEDPEIFRPERFLQGNKNQETYTFGFGKRKCLGDALARASMFVIFVTVLKHYTVCAVPGKPPSEKPTLGITLKSKPYTATFIPRTNVIKQLYT